MWLLYFITQDVNVKDDIEIFKRQFVERISKFAKDNNIEDYEEDKEPSVSLQRLFAPLVKNRLDIRIYVSTV